MNDLFTFENLLKAYYDCRRNKRRTVNAAKFELDFEKELLSLEGELRAKTYRPGRSICFVVTRPTLREVFAADFRDRVVHHLLVNYMEPVWEKKFIHHSYACRKGKGAHQAVRDLKRILRRFGSARTRPLYPAPFSTVSASAERCGAYYLKADISAFFMSLKKNILYNIIRRHIRREDILWLARRIIFHDPTQNYYLKGDPRLFRLIPPHKSLFSVPTGQGLPIGNLTSQFFANVYLNELDQFVKHQLKIRRYLRYVDDILILDRDPARLKTWQGQIDRFLADNLGVRLHPDKSFLMPAAQGIKFVGFIVNRHYSLIGRRTAGNLKRKLWRFRQIPVPETPEIFQERLNEILSAINSYYGQFRHGDTYKLQISVYRKHFGVLRSWLEPADENFSYFRLKRNPSKPAS